MQYGPRRMKLRDLMGATLRFLQSDRAKFRVLWDWSACVSQLLTSDVMVRGCVRSLRHTGYGPHVVDVVIYENNTFFCALL